MDSNINVDAILNSLKQKMQESEAHFKQVNLCLNDTIEKYEKCISDLKTQREQIRGEYTCLYNLYQQYAGNSNLPEKSEDVENAVTEVEEDMNEEAIQSNEVEKFEENTVLTEQEVELIKKELNQSTTLVSPQSSTDDIPEYLKEEYNK